MGTKRIYDHRRDSAGLKSAHLEEKPEMRPIPSILVTAIAAGVCVLMWSSPASASGPIQPWALELETRAAGSIDEFVTHLTYDVAAVQERLGCSDTPRFKARLITPTVQPLGEVDTAFDSDSSHVAGTIPITQPTADAVYIATLLYSLECGNATLQRKRPLWFEHVGGTTRLLTQSEFQAYFIRTATDVSLQHADSNLEPGDVPGEGVRGPHETATVRCGPKESCGLVERIVYLD